VLKAASIKKQILLVDDDQSITDMLTMLFETRGYRVTTAHSGEEALQKASSSIDLVLLDIILPDQAGFHVCRKLKENKETRDVSIIILTGKLMTQDITEALYLGADDYLIKPFEYEELVARMEAVMRRGGMNGRENLSLDGDNGAIMELRKIVDEELIVPYFQPIFLLEPFRLYGYEALSRPKTQSALGSPELLFKLAVQFGFYQDLELIAWKKSLKYASDNLGDKKLFLNCNPYLVEGPKFITIQSLFNDISITPSDVFLEITERSAISNFKSFYEYLKAFRDFGFHFAVDDVGGGYASLESIVETRPEVVKIDRHILTNLSRDAFKQSIVKFMVSFCKENNILLVAEGIETKDDFCIIKKLGIDAGQGYYFGRPSPRMEPESVLLARIFN